MAENTPKSPTLLEQMSSEVTPATSPLLTFLTTHAKLIAIVMVLCFAGAAGYGIYTWNENKKIAEAQEALSRILVLDNDADRLAKLEAFLPTAPDAMRKGLSLIIASTAMKAKKYEEAFKAWESLATDPRDPLYVTASIGKADSLAPQGKAGEGLAVLEGMTLPADSPAAGLVNILIVNFAEDVGNTEKAIAACEKIIAAVAAVNPEEADFWRQKAAALRLAAKS